MKERGLYFLLISVITVSVIVSFISMQSEAMFDLITAGIFYGFPGLIFTLLFVFQIIKEKINWINLITFIVTASMLYVLVFYVTFALQMIGLFIIPGIGAYFFLKLANNLLNYKMDKNLLFMSLGAGGISTALGLSLNSLTEENIGIHICIVIWWLYMATLITINNRNQLKINPDEKGS